MDNLIIVCFILGLILSLNPLLISVLVNAYAGSVGKGRPKVNHAIAGAFFVTSFFVYTYLLMIIIANDFAQITRGQLFGLAIIIALLSIIWGTWHIKNYFWPPLQRRYINRLHHPIKRYTLKQSGVFSATMLGLITATAMLVYYGFALAGLVSIVSLADNLSLRPLLGATFGIATTLLTIYILLLKHTKPSAIIKWKEDSKNVMSLASGIAHIVVAWLILLLINGTISL